MSETVEPSVSVSGDAEGGWIVDVHDGDKHGVYSPKGKTIEEVKEAALKEHGYKKPTGKRVSASESDQPEKPEPPPAPPPQPVPPPHPAAHDTKARR